MSTPTFTKLAQTPVKCMHPQRRQGRTTLNCVRPKGHEGNHLHDYVVRTVTYTVEVAS